MTQSKNLLKRNNSITGMIVDKNIINYIGKSHFGAGKSDLTFELGSFLHQVLVITQLIKNIITI